MPDLEIEIQSLLPDLWRYAFYLTRDRTMADDLMQDCAERALRKKEMYHDRGSLKSWLFRMLLNIHRNQLRSPAHRANTSIEDVAERATPDATADHMALKDTARALDQLPAEQRDALLAVVIGGMAYKDAAAALDIPMGTLMSRIGRARAALRVATGGLS